MLRLSQVSLASVIGIRAAMGESWLAGTRRHGAPGARASDRRRAGSHVRECRAVVIARAAMLWIVRNGFLAGNRRVIDSTDVLAADLAARARNANQHAAPLTGVWRCTIARLDPG